MIRLGRHVLRFGVVQAQHGHGGAQHVHAVRLGDAAQKLHDRRGQRPGSHQIFLDLIQLRLLGQPAVPKEVDDLFENGVVGQRMDVVAAVAEDAEVSVDITNLGLAGDYAFEASYCRSHGSLLSVCSLIVERDGAPETCESTKITCKSARVAGTSRSGKRSRCDSAAGTDRKARNPVPESAG